MLTCHLDALCWPAYLRFSELQAEARTRATKPKGGHNTTFSERRQLVVQSTHSYDRVVTRWNMQKGELESQQTRDLTGTTKQLI